MALPLAAISAGVGIAGKLFGKKPRKPDNRAAIAALRASRPTGYLTPEDMRAAELTRGRLTQGVQAQGRLGGYEIGRRFQARGLAGSPSEERSRARLQQETLLGAENAGNTAEEQLYNMRTGREAYQHQNDLAIFGAQTDQNQREWARQQAQQGAFWNSLNEFVPTIMSGINRTPTVTTPYGPMQPTPTPTQPGTPLGPSGGQSPLQPRGFNPEAQVRY